MNCAFCEKENNQIIKEHTLYELEWDEFDEPYFFEFRIGLCKEHQNDLEEFSKKQIIMNQIQLFSIVILLLLFLILLIFKKFWISGIFFVILLFLIWVRNRPTKRYLRSEEDCVAYGYQNIQEKKNCSNDKDIVLYFSKKEKERIFRV